MSCHQLCSPQRSCVTFPRSSIRFEVWDRDNRWNDDLLGRVYLIPTSGRVNKRFKLKHGSLFVHVAAQCAPSLQGSLCEQYAASPSYEEVMGYVKEDQKVQEDLRGSWSSGPQVPDSSVL